MKPTLKNLKSLQLDLSHLPEDVQETVGPEIAQTVVSQLTVGNGPVIVGKLGPGIYGFVNPELLGPDILRPFNEVLAKARG